MGTIDTVDAASRTISMNHEAIPALKWPAMTMEFGLADGNVVERTAAWTIRAFQLEDRGNGEFVITRLEKMDGKTTTSHQGRTEMLGKLIEWSARNVFIVVLAPP